MTKISKEEFVKWFNKNFNRYMEEDIGEIGNLYYCTPKVIYDLLREESKIIVDADHLAELKKLIENFPKCEECPIFLKLIESSQRTVACETARAIEDCPKDKYMEELRKLV